MIPIYQLDDNHLLVILRRFRTKGMILFDLAHKDRMPLSYDWKSWQDLMPPIFFELVKEAERRSIEWDCDEHFGVIDLTLRGTLERGIVGALRDAINSHGPITTENAHSAAKRVIGAIKVHNGAKR